MNETTTKNYVKNNIKMQLWTFSHSVKDLEGTPGIGYDLLVNGRIRVCIVTQDQDIKLLRKKCDVVAAEIGEDRKKMYSLTKKPGWKTPTEIFGSKTAHKR